MIEVQYTVSWGGNAMKRVGNIGNLEGNLRSGELPDKRPSRKESLNCDKFHKHSYLNRDLIISATV